MRGIFFLTHAIKHNTTRMNLTASHFAYLRLHNETYLNLRLEVFSDLIAVRHLSSLSGGRGLVLVGDKGYVSDEEMKGERDPHIAYHGSLSCMVRCISSNVAFKVSRLPLVSLLSEYGCFFRCVSCV